MEKLADSCLTYVQLELYAASQNTRLEYPQLHEHIILCELCKCAVKGFNADSFTYSAIQDLFYKIDKKANAGKVALSPLFKSLVVVVLSITLILLFFNFISFISVKKSKTTDIVNSSHPLSPLPFHKKISTSPKLAVIDNSWKGAKVNKNKSLKKVVITPELLENIRAWASETRVQPLDSLIQNNYSSDIVYIFDLKVADYYKLYYKSNLTQMNFKNHTSAFMENSITRDNESEINVGQKIEVKKILEKGLFYFKQEKYNSSITEFQYLLEVNPNDVNGLFYCAMSFFCMEKYDLAIQKLNAVLSNNSSLFFQEAKWTLTLCCLKTEKKENAKQLLLEIITENGFYAKQAVKKLMELK